VSEPLWTARQLAARLGVSTEALLRWTRAGRVPPAVKLPSGAVRYRPELIDPWLDSLAMGAADRGVLTARTDRARDEGYAARPAVAPGEDGAALSFPVLTAPPPPAATTTEEEHDAC
jgi:predicted DNA-binding transcriptional regulator AlpA